ncbi:hypothetical protein GCE86_09280 [Micromonospora terminaliae]|uniref:Uncharacterized protein n=1 Tax=Micromonospora terminaliae TaxID=1914461 RepID=A0AAJ2ZEW9_9ACTN|nr:hypothetical protein [Micromonospora terminaliae]NES28029.1 hypothetical protein [Micromonospora terminaliae]QGL47215.1 hypothetical protein GCE86_09280 [Micromonospora terminaliae]
MTMHGLRHWLLALLATESVDLAALRTVAGQASVDDSPTWLSTCQYRLTQYWSYAVCVVSWAKGMLSVGY